MSWSKEVVDILNARQKNYNYHPYTCDTPDCGQWIECHNFDNELHKVFFRSELIATENGWICPNCDYTQNWFL